MTPATRRTLHDPGHPKVGERAREQLLVAAGEVFAEQGYGRATSKEICERAGMNSAAVNYHFGGFEALYSQTLAHAHQQLIAIEVLKDIAASRAMPRQKLRAVISMIVRRLAFPNASWEMRLISREIISPSPAREAFFRSEVLPKLTVLRGIVAAMIGARREDPVVGRTMLTLLAPAMLLAIMQRDVLTHVMPGLAHGSDEIDPLIDHIERFISAGLAAVASHLRSTPSPSKPRVRPQAGRRGSPPTATRRRNKPAIKR
jgi:AcrR family transcriptional regulator